MMTMIPITMTSTMKMTGGILMIGLPGLLNSQMMKLQHMLLLQRLPLRLLPLKTSMAARATKEKARKASPNSLQDPSAPIVGPNFTDLRIVLWRHHLLTAHRCSVPPTIMILGQSIARRLLWRQRRAPIVLEALLHEASRCHIEKEKGRARARASPMASPSERKVVEKEKVEKERASMNTTGMITMLGTSPLLPHPLRIL